MPLIYKIIKMTGKAEKPIPDEERELMDQECEVRMELHKLYNQQTDPFFSDLSPQAIETQRNLLAAPLRVRLEEIERAQDALAWKNLAMRQDTVAPM